MNLANVARSDMQRGDVVALPGQFSNTVLIDARVQLLPDAPKPLAHNTQVDFYTGSQEVPATLRLLDTDELPPGQSAWAQLRLSRAAVMARRDRFILRIPSPSMTVGGGEVIDVHPRYHRRHQPAILASLETLARGTPEELALAALDRRRVSSLRKDTTGRAAAKQGLPGYELADIAKHSNLSQDVTRTALETLLQEGRVRQVGMFWFAATVWEAVREETTRLLEEQHRAYPLRSGLSKEEWRARLGLPPKIAAEALAALEEEGVAAEATGITGAMGGFIRLPGFTPTFTSTQQQQVERLLRLFSAQPYTPPGRSEAEAQVGAEALGALIEQGTLVRLGNAAETVLFLREHYQAAIEQLIAYLREHGSMTAAEARDILGTTRKYILPLLEHMDERRLTRRVGDERVLGPLANTIKQAGS